MNNYTLLFFIYNNKEERMFLYMKALDLTN